MKSNEIIKKMATSCKVLNDVLRDSKKYDELEKNGKMHKMNDVYNLCRDL